MGVKYSLVTWVWMLRILRNTGAHPLHRHERSQRNKYCTLRLTWVHYPDNTSNSLYYVCLTSRDTDRNLLQRRIITFSFIPNAPRILSVLLKSGTLDRDSSTYSWTTRKRSNEEDKGLGYGPNWERNDLKGERRQRLPYCFYRRLRYSCSGHRV